MGPGRWHAGPAGDPSLLWIGGAVARPNTAKKLRAAVIRDLIRAGWNPPTPTDAQAHRILDDIVRLAHDRRGRQARSDSLGLTAHELRVLGMIADGLTVPEVADQLERSPETVKKTVRSVRRKLGARNGPHAVAIGFRTGILS